MKIMRTFSLTLFLLFLLGGLTTINAQPIDAGNSATFKFDFSGDITNPPYNGYQLGADMDYFVDPLSNIGDLHIDLYDTSSSYTNVWVLHWLHDAIGLYQSITYEDYDSLFFDDVIYANVVVDQGAVDVNSINMLMQGAEITGYVDGQPIYPFTSRVQGELVSSDAPPVPEPTTMLLFGAGLVGLSGFGRKKFKK